MSVRIVCVAFFSVISILAFTQVAGDYRSAGGGGNWSALGSWQRYTGAAWAVPTALEGYPGQNAGTGVVTVRFLNAIVLDVTPANNIGSLSLGLLGNLSTTGNPSLAVTGNLQLGLVSSFIFGGTGNLTVNGTTTLQAAGAFTDNNGTGISTFTGGVTLNAGATWNSAAVTATSNLVFKGGIANNSATFSAGGATFNTNPQALSGSLSFTNAVTVTGINVTNNGIVTMSGTGAGVLNGTGTWTQGATGTLNYSGSTMAIGSLVATAAGNIIVYNSSVPQTVQPVSYQRLVLNNTSAVIPQITLAGNVTVSSALTMTSGVVDLSGFSFTLGSAGTASALTRTASTTTNWMYGGTFTRYWLNATAVTSASGNNYGLFPLGEPTGSSYSPFEINSTANPTADGSFSVTYSPNPYMGTELSPFYNDGGTNVELVLNSGFVTSVSGITGGTYNVDATMTGVNPAGALGDIRLVVFTGGTTASAVGTHAAAVGTVVNPTAKRTGLSIGDLASRDFRLGTSNKGVTPLPVEFLSFDAAVLDRSVLLSWSTAAEFNSDHFWVQRSQDGMSFTGILRVDAAGNSNTVKKYSSVDADPYEGISYYRLMQVDHDGDLMFSQIVKVNFSSGGAFSVYPNPSSGRFNVNLCAQAGEKASLVLQDEMGREIYSEVFLLSTDNETIAIEPFGKLTAGVYLVTVGSGDQIYQKKLVIR